MQNNNFPTKEKSFRDIVLNAVEKVLEINSKELRLYQRIVPMTQRSDLIIEEEDTRISFCQSVQGLALILKPYFDNKMEEVYGDFDELVDCYYYEFFEKYRDYVDNLFKTERRLFISQDNNNSINSEEVKQILQHYKVKRAKEIFRELNLLLKRQDYLQSSIYGDTEHSDDVIEEEADG